MDTGSHALWAAAAGKAVNDKTGKKTLNLWFAAFWGMFPDLFAFTIPFVMLFWGLFTGTAQLGTMHGTGAAHIMPGMQLAGDLYQVSHSLIVFAVVFALAWFVRGKPLWELYGWLMHILFDIPTHSADFFPTPLFWPISDWRFTHGFSWGQWWFMALDYGLLVVVFIVFWLRKRKMAHAARRT